MSNELITVSNYCELSKTSLKFKREVTKEQWGQVFSGLKTIEGCVQFWIGDCLKYREQKWGMYEDVVEEGSRELKTIQNIKYVSDSVESSRRREDLSFTHHSEVAPLEPQKQEEYLQKAVDNDWTVRELRDAIKEDKIAALPKQELPEGKFNVIYADPPWQFSNSGLNESAENTYASTMATEDICAMPIKELTTPDTVIFMWATNAMLKDALSVLEAWGFEYKTNICWAKNKGPSIGWFLQTRHELLLIGTRSNNTHPKLKPVSWFEAGVRAHSQKPDEAYVIIEKMYDGPYVELFARNTKEGWISYGNEISKD